MLPSPPCLGALPSLLLINSSSVWGVAPFREGQSKALGAAEKFLAEEDMV